MDDLRALIEAVNLTEDDIRKAMTARRDGKSRVVQEWTNRKAAALRAKLEGE
jgi:chorismate synthase